jgi:hypothetical protein
MSDSGVVLLLGSPFQTESGELDLFSRRTPCARGGGEKNIEGSGNRTRKR